MEPVSWTACVTSMVAVAVWELDVTHMGQTMISRPSIVGTLLGLICHRLAAGANLGICLELFSVDDLPMGANLPLNATVAVAAALLMSCNPRPLSLELALPLGLGAGWAHRCLEIFLRQLRCKCCYEVEERISFGREPGFGRIMLATLAQQTGATLAVLLVFVLVLGPALSRPWLHAPHVLVIGLQFGLAFSGWLGLATLLYALRVTP